MIIIIASKTRYDDNVVIRTLDITFKSIDTDGKLLTDHPLIATIMCAITKTTLLKDEENKGFLISPEAKHNNIANLKIRLGDNTLTRLDIANFLDALQRALDETSIF